MLLPRSWCEAPERAGLFSPQADAHPFGYGEQLAALGDVAGLAGDVLQAVGDDVVVHQSHGDTVLLDLHQLGGVAAELGGQHTVIGAGAAAALHVAGDADAGLHAGLFLDGGGDAVGGGGVTGLGALGRPFLPLHLGFLHVHGTLGHGDDGEVGAALCPALHGVADMVDVVGLLGQQDDVGTACDAGVQGQPAGLVAHDLDAHDPAVAAGGGVDAVDDVGGDVHGGMEAEGDIGAVDVVINGLGQADDVQPLLREEVGGLVGAVAAQAEQAVQLRVLVGLFHGRDLVDLVLFHHPHQLEGGALGAQDGAAQGQDAPEVVLGHLLVLAVDEAVVAVQDAHDLHIIAHPGIQGLCHAADRCVQARAVAAGGQDANTFFHLSESLVSSVFPTARQGSFDTIRVFPKGGCVKMKFASGGALPGKKNKKTSTQMCTGFYGRSSGI